MDVDLLSHKIALEALRADAERNSPAVNFRLNLQEVRLPCPADVIV